MTKGADTVLPALTIKQPWASLICDGLIVHGWKDIENRTWPTRVRGRVLIHASKRLDLDELEAYKTLTLVRDIRVEWLGPRPKFGELPCGGIIGMVEIVDCVEASESPWFTGPYGFVIANPRPLPFFACRGALGFWQCRYPGEIDLTSEA